MDKLRRREDLLRAAREVFARKGYHESKVEDIAAHAGVGKGTLYLYFSDKSSIMQEILDRILVLLEGAILRLDPDGDLPSQIKHNIRAIVAIFLDDPTLPRLLLSPVGGGEPDFQRKVQEFMTTVHQLLGTALRDGQGLGLVAPGDPAMQAWFALGALKEVLLRSALSGANREHVVDALYDMLSVGFLRSGARLTDLRVTEAPAAAGKRARSVPPAPPEVESPRRRS